MKIKFWGVRGSIPTPISSSEIQRKIRSVLKQSINQNISNPKEVDKFLKGLNKSDYGTVGGNTACIEVQVDGKIFIFDMGSGMRNLGQDLYRNNQYKDRAFYIFLTHTHWDHISGFPFFYPAFFPENQLILHSTIPDFKKRLELQQDPKFFPVSMKNMHCEKKFVKLDYSSTISYEDIEVSNLRLHHPGGSFSYRLDYEEQSFVYATDSEFRNLSDTFIVNFKNFCRNADVLVIDAQYTFEEAIQKEDWGHSSAMDGINIAVEAGVDRIFLFHHDPNRNDQELEKIHRKAINYHKMNFPNSNLEIFLAREGAKLNI
ncbi:MAG: MBL fold metallo-hydrolase [Candidatus Marinimicrobia bacterium]|nr:MBL fold metallo-hydrolase [Candidatus Neomarinimicrobiota bacterium]